MSSVRLNGVWRGEVAWRLEEMAYRKGVSVTIVVQEIVLKELKKQGLVHPDTTLIDIKKG